MIVVMPGSYYALQGESNFVVQEKLNPSMMVKHIENVGVRIQTFSTIQR